PPSQDLAARPVHDRHQGEEPPPHLDVGYVRAPDLVLPLDRQVAQQIRIDLVLRMRLTGLGPLIDRRQAHPGHQPTDAMAPDATAVAPQMPRHLPRAVPGRLQELLVDETHQKQVLSAVWRGFAVERRAADRYQLALAHDREPWMTGVDHRLPPIQAQRSKAFDKKSRSTTSWPILACSFVSSASRFCSRALPFSSKTLANFSIASRFQAAIWVGCSSCLVASSATVSWPLIASSATLALNSAENRLRVLMVDRPLHRRIHRSRLVPQVVPTLSPPD